MTSRAPLACSALTKSQWRLTSDRIAFRAHSGWQPR